MTPQIAAAMHGQKLINFWHFQARNQLLLLYLVYGFGLVTIQPNSTKSVKKEDPDLNFPSSC
jgi:hypothetical protein